MEGKLAEAYVEIGGNLNPFNASLSTVKRSLSALASTRFTLPGGGFAAMLGGAALVGGLSRAINGASDLSETMSKVKVTFADSSSVVTQSADEMAKAFGIPKREFLDAASQFGLIATGMGQSKDEAAQLSVNLAKLAADASSFYNVPVAEALEKIRAGLTGESEPLKAFGVIMDETTMKAEAQRLGLGRNAKELTNREKLIARVALIEKGLSSASGDLARTQDGAANQARRFQGMLTNLGDTIGTTMLPTLNSFLSLLNNIGDDMAAAAASGSGVWSSFLGTIKGVFDTAGLIYRNWSDIVERTGVMVGGHLQNIGERFAHLGHTIKSFLDWFADTFPKVMAQTAAAGGKVFANLSDMFKNPEKLAAKIIAGSLTGNTDMASILSDNSTISAKAFKAPVLRLSDNAGQLAEIDRRMAAREADRLKATGVAAAAADKNAKGAQAVGSVDAASKGKAGIVDFDAATKEFMEAGLKTETVQAKILDQSTKQVTALEQIRDMFRAEVGKARGMGAGMGVAARFA